MNNIKKVYTSNSFCATANELEKLQTKHHLATDCRGYPQISSPYHNLAFIITIINTNDYFY